MTAMEHLAPESRESFLAEIQDLQRSLLPWAALSALGIGWLWFLYITIQSWDIGLDDIAAAVLVLGMLLGLRLRAKHHGIASWTVLLALMAAIALLAAVHPHSFVMAFGVLVIILANALLSIGHALLAATLMSGVGLIVHQVIMAQARPVWGAADVWALYYLAWGTVWLATRPLRASINGALAGWARAREALAENRERRAELHRVVRALEEATFRLERTNQELIIARREAEMARTLKARFAATVSHELRGPLHLILGFSRMMVLSPEKYGVLLPHAYVTDADAIYRNTQHLAALIDDILDLSQIEAAQLPLVKDRTSLEQDVIQHTVNTARPLAERKGLYLRQYLAADIPWILADPVRLRQVLLNLLSNAVRLTERGGITVCASHNGGEVIVSVQDTGPGIAPEDMSGLFQPFRRVNSTATPEGGTGLGLSISKQLIELHGGRIWVESSVGVGSTFSFSLPLPGSGVQITTRTQEAPQPKATLETCLLVHDDPGVVRLLARYMEKYHVVGLADEQEVVPLVEQLHPRVIVTTPRLAGRIKHLLARTPFDVPIISCAMPHLADQDILRGIRHYLVKPISTEVLATVMQQLERSACDRRRVELTVLLVDDEPDAVQLLESMLTAIPYPYRFLRAYDGAQALEMARKVTPDVVFIDLIMPGMGGWETIAQMRADAQLQGVSIVVTSAKDWVEGQVTVSPPISVITSRPIGVAQWAQCLQRLVDTLTPRYLPDPAPV